MNQSNNSILHTIDFPRDIAASLGHTALMEIERLIQEKNLLYFQDIPGCYKFSKIEEVLEKLKVFGEVFRTPMGAYISRQNSLITVNFANQNKNVGIFVTLDLIYNNKENVQEVIDIRNQLVEYLDAEVNVEISWNYVSNHELQSVTFYDVEDSKVYDEAYPDLNMPINKYLKKYLDHPAPVLLMIGPPGTGKTRLIKHFIHQAAQMTETARFKHAVNRKETNTFDVMYSNSQAAYNHDELFIRFLSYNYQMLVLEDIDMNLSPRLSGANEFMHKLLNASDGIVNIDYKKIIITTNITHEQKTDSALLRPGRTFDIMKTRKLTKEEAEKLAKKANLKIDINTPNELYSLAELYNNQVDRDYKPALSGA